MRGWSFAPLSFTFDLAVGNNGALTLVRLALAFGLAVVSVWSSGHGAPSDEQARKLLTSGKVEKYEAQAQTLPRCSRYPEQGIGA